MATREPRSDENGRALTLHVGADGIGIVTFDIPGESQNTLKPSFRDDWEHVVAELESNRMIKAVVLISGKEDTFIAGADVSVLKTITTQNQAEEMSRLTQDALARWA